MIRILLFLTAFVSAIFASIPPQTNTPYAQVITESKANGTEIHYTYGNDLIGDGTHYFLTDALGSTRGLVDSSESLTDSYDYKPYGELAIHTGTSENSFLFTGEQLDQEANNYYLRARYYSPSLTRFLSRDTYDGKVSDPLSQNHYLYAGGNPVIYVDPSGEFSMMGVINSMAIIGTLSGIGTSFINSNRFASDSNMRCWLECMQKHNPLHPAFSSILGLSGSPVPKVLLQKIPKSWLKAMGLRVFMLPSSSPYTTLPSALSVMLKQGGRGLLRGIGRNSYYGVLIYGTYMNILQGSCLYICSNGDCQQ